MIRRRGCSARGILSDIVAAAVACGFSSLFVAPSVVAGDSGRASEPEPACDYYASPAGIATNDGLTALTPFRPRDFWGRARPGKTLCLMDGVYRGDAFMLNPHNQHRVAPVGTSAHPVTIRALHDGRVRIDGQGERRTVHFNGAQWLVLEGFDAHNSSESVVGIINSSNITVRRLVMWDARDCEDSSCAFHVWTTTKVTNVTCEDCASFGRGRKMFQPQISANFTCRRCWGRHEGYMSQLSKPKTPYHPDYNTSPALLENVIGIWSSELKSTGNPYPILHSSPGGGGTRILGSLAYVMPSATWTTAYMVGNIDGGGGNLTIQDTVGYMVGWSDPNYQIFSLRDQTSGTLTATRLSSFGPGNSIGRQWMQSGVCRSTKYPGTCSSPFNPSGANARLCHRYVNGNLTTEPLWPWPMDERIKNALAVAGRSPLKGGTVTTEIESFLGPIPAACRADGLGR